jgi:hypothetical protein
MKLVQGILGPDDVGRKIQISMEATVTYLDDDMGMAYLEMHSIKAEHDDGHDSVTEWRFAIDPQLCPTLRIENFPG